MSSRRVGNAVGETLAKPLVETLVGVIDLKGGKAVHARAGHREAYRPVQCVDGDAIALAHRYARQGLKRLYLADLDAIEGRQGNAAAIDAILRLEGFDRVLVDAGWRLFAGSTPVLASECFASSQSIRRHLARRRIHDWYLGLDFRGGEFLGEDMNAHLSLIDDPSCHGVIVLDLAAVGTGKGIRTAETVRGLRNAYPDLPLFSGGGVIDLRDVRRLTELGCHGVLVATALHAGSLKIR